MSKVHCFAKECVYNGDDLCLKDEISLYMVDLIFEGCDDFLSFGSLMGYESSEDEDSDGTAFIERHGLGVDHGEEIPFDLKAFLE